MKQIMQELCADGDNSKFSDGLFKWILQKERYFIEKKNSPKVKSPQMISGIPSTGFTKKYYRKVREGLMLCMI